MNCLMVSALIVTLCLFTPACSHKRAFPGFVKVDATTSIPYWIKVSTDHADSTSRTDDDGLSFTLIASNELDNSYQLLQMRTNCSTNLQNLGGAQYQADGSIVKAISSDQGSIRLDPDSDIGKAALAGCKLAHVVLSHASVPFVGCQSDGQGGPIETPKGGNISLKIRQVEAARLAFYGTSQSFGALAPRGWHCFGTYGSNGQALFISPEPTDPANFFSSDWGGLPGFAIELSESHGDTSGRFAVARIIGRVFPAYSAFTRNVVETEGLSAGDFPFGTYPGDKLTYKSEGVVEYITASQSEGLGTQSRLRKNDSPIVGAAIIIGDPPNLIQLSMRLPSGFDGIDTTIIHQVELQSTAQAASQH